MRRLLVLGELLASISLDLVVLSIGARRALVGIWHIGAVVFWRNFLVHFDLCSKSWGLRIRTLIYALKSNI
jgi:hypothetical protein